jgi:outer membrane protein OmpA-like peptidoglycan-associated protein
MVVPLPGQEQPHWVADSSVGRLYHRPGLSNLELITAYEAALKQAGWTVLEAIAPRQGSNPHLLARYTRNGRDLWLLLSGGGGDISLRVADAGIDDAAARLKRECRLPLSGVFFDFDRATLRPDSEPALRRGQSALVANAGLNVEIQGHTDNVGQDAYNLKLSESRAAAVADWLAANGVARSRLSSRGFGRLQPVADNATDDGRARNRRVEIVCRK